MMKAFLLFKKNNLDVNQKLPWNEKELIHDLELTTLFNAMGRGEEFIFEIARRVILLSMNNEIETILYRQKILQDCLRNPVIVKNIYEIVLDAIEKEKEDYWGWSNRYPIATLDRAISVMGMFVSKLRKLRKIADDYKHEFKSEGFNDLFDILIKELTDDYFVEIQTHLRDLKFVNGILISAELGNGNKGTDFILRKPSNDRFRWLKRIFTPQEPLYAYTIADRDEAGARALSELKNRGINQAANALAQSCDHILDFMQVLKTELAFYIGCMNLSDKLKEIDAPLCFPTPLLVRKHQYSFNGLYDVCLSLTMQQKVIGNDLDAKQKNFVVITGANQGGKSTFLRSIGVAQLMMQSGMFVAAESFTSNICDHLFTHFKHEEDVLMNSGKLDEELARMNEILNHITPNAMLIFNESFAATNEKEGSEIARQIISALYENNYKILFVTHLYDFASSIYKKKLAKALFLRAERKKDGFRTFKISRGAPLQTSFGKDLYNRIFRLPKMKIEIK